MIDFVVKTLMAILMIVFVILCGSILCTKPKPWRYVGVPAGVRMRCPVTSDEDMRCVGGDRAYLCIKDWGDDTISCAPLPTEAR